MSDASQYSIDEVRTAVEALDAQRDGQSAAVGDVAVIAAGHNATFTVRFADAREAVLKIGTRTPERFPVEARMLRFVSTRTDVPVPVVLGSADVADDGPLDRPMLLMSKPPGSTYECNPLGIGHDRLARVCAEAGRNLGRLHEATAGAFDAYGPLGPVETDDAVSHNGASHNVTSHNVTSHDGASHNVTSHDGASHNGASHDGASNPAAGRATVPGVERMVRYDSWHGMFGDALTYSLDKLGETRFADLGRQLEQYTNRLTDGLAAITAGAEPTPVVAHGDYRLGNLLVGADEVTGPVTQSVLDWGGVFAGDPAYDLVRTATLLTSWPGVDDATQSTLCDRLYESYGSVRSDPRDAGASFDARRRLYRFQARLNRLRHVDAVAEQFPEDAVERWVADHRDTLLSVCEGYEECEE